jgi:uncharacterized protein
VSIYLDSAAIVKLAHAEAETNALRGWLADRSESAWFSSVLAEIESARALARHSPKAIARLPRVLDPIELVELDPAIRALARTVRPVSVRTLDAIHLATALRLGERARWFVTYDKRLANAAAAVGLDVVAPSGAS